MTAIPVVYRQALTGTRWRYYGAWTKFVPLPVLERVGGRLPVKPLWQERIACGDREAELAVLGGAVDAERSKLAVPTATPVVYSHNLLSISSRQDLLRGRALALGLLRRILPDLTRQLALFGDRLSVALAVATWERAFWLLGLEQLARSLTVFLQPNESVRSIGYTGVALRETGYDTGLVDAHVLVVSPACLEAVSQLALREGTLLLCTDGLALEPPYGCCSVAVGLANQLGLPTIIWAERRDEFPVLETVITTAFQNSGRGAWPGSWQKQISAMDRALAWSEWPTAYQLIAEGKGLPHGELEDGGPTPSLEQR